MPSNKSVNFTSKKIEFGFDEYIQLKDAQKQILISPPMANFPELKVKGKKLILEIQDTLKSKATYSISFGNAITDITEGNSMQDFKYVFSTDSFIDTFMLKGSIINSYTLLAEENMMVAVYNLNTDSCAQKNQPSYFAKADKQGNFLIENIKQGEYYLAAFTDLNSNYLYDADEERIAFLKDLIVVDDKTKIQNLLSFKALPHKLFVKKSTESLTDLQVVFNKPPSGIIKVSTIQKLPETWCEIEKSKLSDTLKIWFNEETVKNDSVDLFIKENEIVIDTIQLNFKRLKNSSKASNRNVKPDLKVSVANLLSGKFIAPNEDILIKLSMPLSVVDTTKLYLILGLDTLRIKTSKIDSRTIHLSAKFLSDSSYKLVIMPRAFKAINGLFNDTSKFVFTLQSIEDVGTFKFTVIASDTISQYVYQLSNESNIIIDEQIISPQKTLFYKQLQPGKYSVKLFADINKNGVWDTGNYNKNVQPEKVYLYPNNLVVRPNWDLEQIWNLLPPEKLKKSSSK